jgi:hypothetical protein
MRRATLVLMAVLALIAVAGCSDDKDSSGSGDSTSIGEPPWPRPANPMELARAAGLTPEPLESFAFHVHAHMQIFIDGKEVAIPGGIGIDVDNPGVHKFPNDGWGGIDEPCDKPCISPLHTHERDGVLHTESPTEKANTLGQFFVEWDQKLDNNCVGEYCRPGKPIEFQVDGQVFDGDPRTIELTDGRHIVIIIGDAPDDVPTDF